MPQWWEKEDPNDIWWRCEVRQQAHWDEWNEYVTGYSYPVTWTPYLVVRRTPKGVVVRQPPFREETFVLGKANKQLCQPTKELAARDEVIRRQRHVRGAEFRLHSAQQMLAASEGALRSARQRMTEMLN